MSSPFQKTFSAKSPLKEKTFTMKELDEKSAEETAKSKANAEVLSNKNINKSGGDDGPFAGYDPYEDASYYEDDGPFAGYDPHEDGPQPPTLNTRCKYTKKKK
jgi:hypothetical protein